jgi:hypothetical protein
MLGFYFGMAGLALVAIVGLIAGRLVEKNPHSAEV